ncbi:hypothetical protein [Telmatospirillum sp.]|uniref:hypothetical protein n=1 Tax=Telmatospirillum sp. TaxID=2079197 RepID=UPI002840AF24|nr:hypothetical protein [Telmatospirillum sp.]MDR3438021.1 hypothetical protein [Telmatospirillum sp.]
MSGGWYHFHRRSAVPFEKSFDPGAPLAVAPSGADPRLRRGIVTVLMIKGAFLCILWLLFFSGGKEIAPQAVADRVLSSNPISTEGK